MESLGAEVDLYHERPYNFIYRIARNKYPKLLDKLNNRFFNSILSNVHQKKYDFVFIIRGEILTIGFLERLRIAHPTSQFIMYQWDSNKLNPFFDKVPMFDKVFSFDMFDCNINKDIIYLPLFFRKEYEFFSSETSQSNNMDIDLLLIGSFHKSREEMVKTLTKICIQKNIHFHSHLFISKGGFIKEIIKGSKIINYSNKSLKIIDIISLFKRSKVILDLPQSGQDGFTMRTFEVLGSNKKLLTTNKNIVNCQFYKKENISVFDLENMNIDFNFITHNLSTEKVDMSNYSILNWVKTIFK